LYDQLVAGGEAAIAQLVTERRQENVSLEFKTKANPATGEPTKEDRQNLGIALSAFSNSMGGVIVWAIGAKKDVDGVDCATELQPIADIERFKSDVTRLVSQAIIPRHEGIFVEAIPAAKPARAGYLAIYVERSERRPHRCEFGVGRYYKRIGDSSIAMEHYDIEDSFKRLVVPWLEVGWRISPGGGSARPDVRQVAIDIHLTNPSPVSARFYYLSFSRFQGTRGPPQGLYNQHRSYSGEYHFSGGADDVIHPGLNMPVAQFLTDIPVEPRDTGQCRVRRGSFPPLRITYRCGCYNSRPSEGKLSVPDDELVERGIVGGFIY
jgi:Putative DNA-binding domain